ncbi:hypothetical protein [Enterobacter hormaechei]|uniref:hypothetical protein n=1 Tax=Enterobacter hormaechei TaxID=158836 RepID=UPI0015D508E8|nr:hypothetical protein [Enterobacter hormaechei]
MNILYKIHCFDRSKHTAAVLKLLTMGIIFVVVLLFFSINILNDPYSFSLACQITFIFFWTMIFGGAIYQEFKAFRKGTMIINRPRNLVYPVILILIVCAIAFLSYGENLTLFYNGVEYINRMMFQFLFPGLVEQIDKIHNQLLVMLPTY